MIDFRFENLRLDGDALSTDWDVLLRIVADFAIIARPAPIPIYQEQEFCVVEFAMQITQWLGTARRHTTSFSYSSTESDEIGLVSLHKQPDGWKIVALHQDYAEDRLFSLEEIESSVASFVTRLKKEVQETFRYDISHLVSGNPIPL
jgi:hypothetical protein